MAEHTPPPWEIEREEMDDMIGVDDDAELGFPERVGPFSYIEHDSTDPEQVEADVAVFSAAPNLLEACRVMMDWFASSGVVDQKNGPMRLMREAIAKAEGRE